jgi:hypothetical protein
VYIAVELMAVLVNLAPVGRHGRSCSRPGAASRVAVWGLPVWSPSVRRAWRCLVVPGSHNVGDGAAVPGMVAQRRG